MVRTQFGEDGGVIMPAADAGNQIALEINTRLVSYSIAFYAALLMASNLKDAMYKFCIGLFWLWLIMAFGLASILGKTLLTNGRRAFPQRTGRPARRSDRTHVSVQRATYADTCTRVFVVLAAARVAALGGPRPRHQTRLG